MTSPIDSRKAFAYFGLMIGSLPTFALILRIVEETTPSGRIPLGLLTLLGIAGIGTGVVGYASGRYVPSAISYAEKFRMPNNLMLLPLIGFAWGAVSGAIGGLFLFVIGSIFAGFMGGIVGAVALPIFVALHSMLGRGELIEMKHFLPIAFGMTLSLCALILGL
jgi:hypothetical protein